MMVSLIIWHYSSYESFWWVIDKHLLFTMVGFGVGTYRLCSVQASAHASAQAAVATASSPAYRSVMQSLMAMQWRDRDGGIRMFYIDTAQSYGTEKDVGTAIRDFLKEMDGSVRRSDIVVTTKIHDDALKKGDYDALSASVESSLEELGLDYIDEILIHKPIDGLCLRNWQNLVRYKRENPNKVRKIGVSNYNVFDLEEIVRAVGAAQPDTEIPAINQIEISPFLQRTEIREFCEQHSIEVVAHSSLAKGEKFTSKKNASPLLRKISVARDITEAQVMLYWAMRKGHRIIPCSSDEQHICENFQTYRNVLDGKNPLTDDDVAKLDSAEETERYATHWAYVRRDHCAALAHRDTDTADTTAATAKTSTDDA